MILDLHVHISALTRGHGKMSRHLLDTLAFRFMKWRLGVEGEDDATERAIADKLVRTIDETRKLDAVVVLAFDAVHDGQGRLDHANTHLHVTNDYAIDLCRKNAKLRFGASVHPYRKDAVAEIERCVKAGAVLMKWLPIVQGFNPADDRCIPFYEALAHHKLPLLSHTGGEKSLPNIDTTVADPALLLPALQRGVKVIMAHCGTRSAFGETDYVSNFMKFAREHEHCYGDTAALCLPTRSHAFPMVLKDKVVREKLVHGSDWPIIALPPASQLPVHKTVAAIADGNWMRRDVAIKEALGFDDAYWHRAAKVLGL
ncbi:amidohydrolase family protein [Humisphaera borealis]|uniref:Amidohydrolase family protein n=1 Tax=Humisphaera borealis TaxID=2807512 RepID=A0A7M2WYV8_9BACT|nr:amidohydrolase family protein [Humisphaera borealis]QOV90031.1 amidohydrolase family protein [Humisphaera borealis]